jgi:hypothetical protein
MAEVTNQRLTFLIRTLKDAGLYEYGFESEELWEIAGQPASVTLPMLIRLKALAVRNVTDAALRRQVDTHEAAFNRARKLISEEECPQ